MSANRPADADHVSDLKVLVEAERSGEAFLLFRDREDRQRLFCFAPGSVSASVGRQPASDLVLDWDGQVSRLHARFELVDNAWVLVDDGLSSNGTFVNEERLTGSRRLNDGDSVRFGTTTVTFRSPQRERSGIADAAQSPAALGLSTTQRRVLTALCRPYKGRGGYASPATDQQIADELFLSVGVVRTHLSVLYAKLEVGKLPPNEARVRLVQRAFSLGLISEREL
ncbi:MAG: FHA domain-containing protein [Solirubrobacteraceae bacterium]